MNKKIEFQNLDWTTEIIIKRFKRNPNSSVSALFRKLRKSPSLSLFADYPIISHIINTLSSVGIYPERNKVAYALRQSVELKGQRSFLNSLLGRKGSRLQKENEPRAKRTAKTMDYPSINAEGKKEAASANS